MKLIWLLWRALLNRGISAGETASRKTAIRVANVALFTCFPALISFDVFYLITGDFLMLSVNVFFLVVMGSLFIFIGRPSGNFLARRLFLLNANMVIFAFSVIVGSNSGAEFFYFVLICIAFLVFSRDEEKWTWIFVGLPFLLYLIREFLVPELNLSLSSIELLGLESYRRMCFAVAGIMLFFLIKHLHSLCEMSQAELEKETAKTVHVDRMAALGQMASGVAHEINNPLSVIKGLSEEALESFQINPAEPDRATLQEYLRRIVLMSERINKIVRALGIYSRRNETDPFDIVAVDKIVSDAVILFENQFRTLGIQFTVTVENPEMRIRCREVQIMQVLVNLLQNAKDAVLERGCSWVRLDVQALEHRWVQFRVMDCGLTKDIREPEKVFEPFYTTKEVGKGTGLGLGLSQGLVLSHGGNIYLDRKSKNTSFVFTVPRYLE